MVSFGLQFEYLYHDVDVLELRITVENARFRGCVDKHVGRGDLVKAASVLKGFPKNPDDTREVILAEGTVRLSFYCKDLAGHPAMRATLKEDSHRFRTSDFRRIDSPECAIVYLDFEPAALDEFLKELVHLQQRLSGTASLTI